MITLSAAATDTLTRGHQRYFSVESWRNGVLLAADVPCVTGTEEVDRSLRVPERVTFTVPREDRGDTWAPGDDPAHPLAANGQTLRVKLGVGLAFGSIEWFQRGRFLIRSAEPNGDTVNVEAVGMLSWVDEARLVSPYQPSGTFASTLRGLVEPALTVAFSTALVDRSVPTGASYDEDRLGAVLELLDAWAADAVVDTEGVLQVVPAAQTLTPVLALTDGAGGTVINTSGSSTRDGAYNAVVARGTAPDGGQVQGVAYDTSTSSPKYYGGPFNPLPVPMFFASPLLTSSYEASLAAATILARIQRQTGTLYTVDMVPHPGLQVGDVVTVNGTQASVETLTLPYHADGGQQRLTVRSIA
jgi:hypothetical protein